MAAAMVRVPMGSHPQMVTTAPGALRPGTNPCRPSPNGYRSCVDTTSGDRATPTEDDSSVVETSNGYLSLASGILIIRTKANQGTEASFAEALDVIGRLGEGVPRPALWDVRAWQGATPDAWGYLIPRIARLVSAVAMIVRADRDQRVGPFPAAIDRLLIPFRIFIDEQKGLEFLRDFTPGPAQT